MTAPFSGSTVDQITKAALAGVDFHAICEMVGRNANYVGVVMHKLRQRGVLPEVERRAPGPRRPWEPHEDTVLLASRAALPPVRFRDIGKQLHRAAGSCNSRYMLLMNLKKRERDDDDGAPPPFPKVTADWPEEARFDGGRMHNLPSNPRFRP